MSDDFKIVGLVLLINEDLFIERVLKNIYDFCDKIIVLDDVKTVDNTYSVVQNMQKDHPKIELHKIEHTRDSHTYVEQYANSNTWVFGVDGDEVFDPVAFTELRTKLKNGEYDQYFQLYGHFMHVKELDLENNIATGWTTPDSRSITKLFNFNALYSWTDCPQERLHQGKKKFKDGYWYDTNLRVYENISWEEDLLKCLHICFIRRSSKEPEEQKIYARTNLADRFLLRPYFSLWVNFVIWVKKHTIERHKLKISEWKTEQYMNGPISKYDVTSFFNK